MAKPLQHQIIARALEIVSDEAHWTRVSLARTAEGRSCACFDPLAARFCAVGALLRAAGEWLGGDGFARALEAEKFVLAANNRSDECMQRINDIEGREVIVAMFKVALGS
jgi:hypothetical protein